MKDDMTNEAARFLVGPGEDWIKLQRQLDKLQMVEWVHGLASWDIISHLTFPWEASMDGARRCYERFMQKSVPTVSYFYAEEQNPGRPGYHVHALWADAKTLYRKEAWAAWHERFRRGRQGARARIEPVHDKGDVAGYCAKYVTKAGAWWNVKLQWHRSQALRGEPFSLERERDTRLPVPQKEFPFAVDVFNLASDPLADAPTLSTAAPEDPRQVQLWRDRGDGVWERTTADQVEPRHRA